MMPRRLATLLGNYPVTAPLLRGEIRSPHVELAFADVPRPAAAFKRVVRNLEFDVSELALVTYLLARAFDKPLVLLPAVVMARFQHPYLVYDATRGVQTPQSLAGKRVAIRSYSVTTAMWIRGLLDAQGTPASSITWLTTEAAHVAEFVDPPNVVTAPAGAELLAMLLAGEVDAAVLAEVPDDPRIKPVFAEPEAAARAWHRATGALQINHMVVVRQSLAANEPNVVREVFRMLAASKTAAGLPVAGTIDTAPLGLDAMRQSLEAAVDCVWRQGMIPRRVGVDELFDDTTRDLRPDQ